MLNRVLIIGGGVAAMRCALELRRQGYEGRVRMVSAEATPPYDRTLVSKRLLSGHVIDDQQLLLQPPGVYENANIELQLGVRATALDVRARRVELADGSELAYDRVVLAVGGEPVRPPRLATHGVVTLRNLGDARQLAPMLDTAERVVIVGGGFIGTEVASLVAARGIHATVVEAAVPFAPLGERAAERICAAHRARGVTLLERAAVDRVRRDGRAFRVDLVDGRRLPADVVVAAVGMQPATHWLATSALRASHGIPTDADGRTAAGDVFATGDCALAPDPVTGHATTTEHWEDAARHGVLVARTVLGRSRPRTRPPYFWSDQLGMKLQMIGRTRGAESVEIEDVEPSPCFVARYRRNGRLVGLFAAGVPHAIGQARREIEAATHAPVERRDGAHRFAYPIVRELVRTAHPAGAGGTN